MKLIELGPVHRQVLTALKGGSAMSASQVHAKIADPTLTLRGVQTSLGQLEHQGEGKILTKLNSGKYLLDKKFAKEYRWED